MDIAEYNRRAWDVQVTQGNPWTLPVSEEIVSAARQGEWDVVLTPQKPVPKSWFPTLRGLRVLCLACGGGQQAPILAAAGACVTVLDNSPRQLQQDQFVARREGLQIESELGDMRDLGHFAAESFDLIFNPCSVSFIPEVQSVFAEAYRVLRLGGLLMCGFVNPIRFIFDEGPLAEGRLEVRHALPYADETHLNSQEKAKLFAAGEPLVFSHSIEDLIAGQARTGFAIQDLYEDRSANDKLSEFLPTYLATLAKKSSSRPMVC